MSFPLRAQRPLIALRQLQAPCTRQFSASSRLPAKANEKDHATDKVAKGNNMDVQSDNAKVADKANKVGDGGTATSRKDHQGAAAKTKKEFPEAPDTIGMQDERGGKGA